MELPREKNSVFWDKFKWNKIYIQIIQILVKILLKMKRLNSKKDVLIFFIWWILANNLTTKIQIIFLQAKKFEKMQMKHKSYQIKK